MNIPPDLPLVAIDDVLIEQLLVNLLDNAVKYTGSDTPIRIMATASDEHVTLEVADRGPGLPRGEEDHEVRHAEPSETRCLALETLPPTGTTW